MKRCTPTSKFLATSLYKEDEVERRRIAKNGYNYVKQFTWDKTAEQLDGIFKKYV